MIKTTDLARKGRNIAVFISPAGTALHFSCKTFLE